MSLWSNRISMEELQPGDHIYAYRRGHTYFHHGIYVGERRVIHFTKTDEKTSSTGEPPCSDCNNDPNTACGVVKTCVNCFLKGHGLFRFEYNVSHVHFFFKNKGTCSTESCCQGGEPVRRASEIFDRDPTHGTGFGEYDLLENNCEAFASYCKRGTRASEQAERTAPTSKTAYVISKVSYLFSSKS